MGFLEIAVIVSCCLIVGGVIVKSIFDKKKGKTSCGCDCSKCSCGCNSKKQTITNNK